MLLRESKAGKKPHARTLVGFVNDVLTYRYAACTYTTSQSVGGLFHEAATINASMHVFAKSHSSLGT